jgi:hypothetical protein
MTKEPLVAVAVGTTPKKRSGCCTHRIEKLLVVDKDQISKA